MHFVRSDVKPIKLWLPCQHGEHGQYGEQHRFHPESKTCHQQKLIKCCFQIDQRGFFPQGGKRSFCHRCHNRRERQGFFYPETFPCEAHIVKDNFARTVTLGASVRVAVGKVIKKSRHVESGIVVFIFMRWSIPWLMARTFAEALRFRFFPTLDSN